MADIDDIRRIHQRVEALKRKHLERDFHAAKVRAVRHGQFDHVAPDLFSDEWPAPIVANRIDTFAQHASAALSPMPIISCSSVTSKSDAAREFADKRTKIANHYFKRSRVQAQMQQGADQFYTYGLIVASVEPDFREQFPDILIEDSIGYYPVWDRMGRTVETARIFTKSLVEVMAEYPDYAGRLRAKFEVGGQFNPDKEVDLVKYDDGKRVVIYVYDDPECVLMDIKNPLGRPLTVAVRSPGLDDDIRGKFDDLIWVQLALHAMQTYTLSAAAQAVQAPIVAPNDVTDIEVGPGAVIRTNDPAGVRRLSLDVPPSAWAAQDYLAKELEFGAIVPEALGGSIDASVVTGKGVQQLMAGYSQQIANGQAALVGFFEQITSLAFQMDEVFWPNVSKKIEGHAQGTPYSLTYRPSRDIRGDYTAEVQYGGIAGLDPNRGLVFLLQAQGAGLVSNDYVRRHLPTNMNPAEEETKIQVEQVRNSLIQGLSAYIQNIPNMEANGQDPSQVLLKAAALVKSLEKGEGIEDALLEMFPPPPPPDPAAAQDPMAALMGGEGGGMGGGPGLAPGLATEGPGGRPPLEMLFAGLNSSGSANLQAGVSRMNPARTV